MSPKVIKYFLKILIILLSLKFGNSQKYFRKNHRKNFELLKNFTCEIVVDELKIHPEMRTVAIVELENKFPQSFIREILKCLPENVAKIII